MAEHRLAGVSLSPAAPGPGESKGKELGTHSGNLRDKRSELKLLPILAFLQAGDQRVSLWVNTPVPKRRLLETASPHAIKLTVGPTILSRHLRVINPRKNYKPGGDCC